MTDRPRCKEPTQKDCAGWAEIAVLAYAKATKSESEPRETQIQDLLSDLMHLCELRGFEFSQILTDAQERWAEE